MIPNAKELKCYTIDGKPGVWRKVNRTPKVEGSVLADIGTEGDPKIIQLVVDGVSVVRISKAMDTE